MKLGIPKEVFEGECRVATTPDVVPHLAMLGFDVLVESGAGERASFSDDAYRDAGADIVADARTLWEGADIVLKVRAPRVDPATGMDEAKVNALEGEALLGVLDR